MSILDIFFGPSPAEIEAERARAEEEARQARIERGMTKIDKTFSQFNPAFYDSIAQSFIDYARPQLDDQYGDATEQLTYSLARGGSLDSSSRVNQEADLTQAYNTQLQSLVDQGNQYATDAEKAVESSRSSLVNTLNATGDAKAATQGALTQADILSQPPAYSPLGQLFTDFTATLEQQAALERAQAATGGAISPRYSTGLFGPSSGAVSVSS